VHDGRDLGPALPPLLDLVEQVVDLDRRGDVLAGPLVDAEPPRAVGPQQQVRQRCATCSLTKSSTTGWST
jgi:hypothetical protein